MSSSFSARDTIQSTRLANLSRGTLKLLGEELLTPPSGTAPELPVQVNRSLKKGNEGKKLA